MNEWTAKIEQNETGDLYSMRLNLATGDAVVLWVEKTYDEAMALVTEFQRVNKLTDEMAGAIIDIVELI